MHKIKLTKIYGPHYYNIIIYNQLHDIVLLNSYYHFVDIFLDGVVITHVNLVQVQGKIDVVPHVVIMLDVILKSLHVTTMRRHDWPLVFIPTASRLCRSCV